MGQRTDQMFERGQLFLNNGNYEQALRLFNQVLNREPTHKGALKNKVLIQIAERETDKARESIEFALSENPKDDELQEIAGSFYINNNDIESGVAHLNRAVELNDGNVLAHYGLGIVTANQYEDHQQAVFHFSKAIEQDPEFADAFFNRGCSYLIEKQMKQARKDFVRARELGHEEAQDLLDSYFME
ncbi:tetratricopeptide repeat protein [Fodinibius sediminis]|uniref:Tfp pilus assembly protein PilF n=1 Tax=Fodinibius sediminis TaxID=1214077 RepID=A0A521AZ06_9BACT|nr:tetratricopeptide repeat protein [Fodinibius sediminis]SMO40068.1 Tfp pilus assembly protein PilF [Fodinibius sediminis]